VAAHTIELVVPPGSRLVGATVAEPVAVVHHDGDVARRGPIQLAAGDVVLVHGDWHRLASGLDEADALVVDGPSDVPRHAGPWGRGSRRTVAIVAAMVVLLATGALPPVIAGLLAAGALVVSGVLTVDDAYRGVNWTTIVLIGGMIPLSTALTASGAADRIADAITWKVGDAGPYVLLAVLFVVVAGLGQLMSNTATALVVIPVALASAGDLGVSPRPVLMSVNVVTVAALLTPVATAANAMVQGPGGYRFGDYARLGLPLLGWWFVIAVAWVPFVWRF
jgi:di/tricarboxylate transporter